MKLESITRVMVKLAFTRFFSRRNQELYCSRIGITILMSKHRFFKKLIKQVAYDG